MPTKWKYNPVADSPSLYQWAQQRNLNYNVIKLAAKRSGYTASGLSTYLYPDLNNLRDPYLLHDMQKTVDRIKQAVENDEQITVYGDYDADGISSASIMYEAIKMYGGNVNYYLPDRVKDGYGPNPRAWQRIIDHGTTLLITVDNGVLASPESMDVIKNSHTDLIITDHHEFAGDYIPAAYAIVHACYPGHEYPFDDFCGAGIAFKVSCALLNRVEPRLLELAAIGTVGDVVSLVDENRIIVAYGLKQMERTDRPGLANVIKKSNINPPITSETLAFQIVPMFNALGRLGDANRGVQLVTTTNDDLGEQLSDMTIEENERRKKISQQITDEAVKQAETKTDQPSLVLTGEHWLRGVVGIVASHIVEKYNKPAIVLAKNDDGTYTGSGRSVEGFDLFAALDPHREDMVAFGGHPGACGLTVNADQVDKLQTNLSDAAIKQLAGEDPMQTINVTDRIPISQVSEHFIKQLGQLEPFGEKNPKPIYEITNFNVVSVAPMGKKNPVHMKIMLTDDDPESYNTIACVAFNVGDLVSRIRDGLQSNHKLHLLGTLGLNHYNGHTYVQIMFVDYKFTN